MAESEATFFSHIEALRKTLLEVLIALMVCWPLSYFLTSYSIQWLINWCCPPELGNLNYFSPMEVFLAYMKLSLIISAIISYPYNAWQIWRFLLPALYEAERRALKWWIFCATFLFAGGAIFCLLVILPMVMKFSSSFAHDGIQPTLGLSNFLNLAGWMMLSFGIMFQFPLVILLAVRFGLITTASLRAKRPYAIVIILILAAILTPPDVVSQLMLAIPTYILFEVGLLASRRFEPQVVAEEVVKSENLATTEPDTMEDFYDFESKRD